MKAKQKLRLTAIFIQDNEDKGYTGYFAEFPQVIAEGQTEEEIKDNLFEALGYMLEWNKEDSEDQRGTLLEKQITQKTFELELA